MDHDADTEPQVILARAGYDKRLPYCLKRSRRKDDSGLLITALDDVPVDLHDSYIEPVVQLEIEAATESHREARLVDVKIVDAEEHRQLRAIDVEFLNRHAKERVTKRLKCWTIFRVVLHLYAAEKVLDRGIDRAASQRAGKIVFAEMQRIVELGPDVLVKVPAKREVEASQGLPVAKHIVDCRAPRITGEVIVEQGRITSEEFVLLVIILGRSRNR